MKPLVGLLLAVGAAVAIGTGLAAKAAPVVGAGRSPVLVELFTSEGCSSCPSADAQLARLVRDQPIDGATIIPLGEHVDYWDRIGWRDPFSSAGATRRQRDYVRALRLDSPYTPQMVVDGRAEFVGSDAARAAAAIRDAAARTKAKVDLDVAGGVVGVRVEGAKAGKGADVMLAVTEDGLSSDVRAGENAGRRLAHVAVVRSLRRIGSIDAEGRFQGDAALALEPSWKRGGLAAVAFVQDPASRRILGVGRAPL